jgi:AraC-like DNA-binding protein
MCAFLVAKCSLPLTAGTTGEFSPTPGAPAASGDILLVRLAADAGNGASAAGGEHALPAIVREIRRRQPGCPVALWIPEAPPQVVIDATRAASQAQVRAILGGGSLDPELLRAQLTQPTGLSSFVLRWASDAGYLPPGMEQDDVRELLDAPPDVRTLARLALRRKVAARTWRSHLQQLGLPSPHAWLGLGHALHVAFFVQRNHTESLQSLCDRLGMQTLANMSTQFRRVFGLSPSKVRDLLGAEPLLHRWFQARTVR